MKESIKTEEQAKSGTRRLGNDALVLTASKVITLLVTMVAGMLLARYRTLGEYGTFSQMQLVINLVRTIVLLGIPNSLNYFLARAQSRAEKKQFLSVYYTFNTVLSALVGVILVLGIPVIEAYFKNPAISGFAYFLALQPWTMIITHSVENLMVTSGMSKGVVVYRVTHSICYLSAVLLMWSLGWQFSTFIFVYVLMEVAFSIVVYVIAIRISGGMTFRFDIELIKKILKFSIPIGLASIVGTLNIEVDKFMIGGLTDPETSAIYAVASHELPVSIIAGSISAVLMPRFARMMKNGRKNEAVDLWGHAIFVSFAVIVLLSFGCAVFAPEFLELCYSAKYLPGVNVFRVYCMVLLLRCTYFGIMLNSIGKTRFILYSSIASLVVNMILNYPLYMLFGIMGPAIATFCSVIMMNIGQLAFSGKAIEVPFSKIFPWKSCAKVIALNIAVGVGAIVLRKLLPLDVLINNWFDSAESVGRIAEAVIMGVVWACVDIAVLLGPIKRHWSLLNAPYNDSLEEKDAVQT